jgi:hypothetical protein
MRPRLPLPWFAPLMIALFSIVPGSASAVTVPQLVNIQGRLADDLGEPLLDGSHQVIFSIYTAASGGAPAWTSTRNVTTLEGVFGATLGESIALPDSVFENASLWLGLAVEADPEMTPRQRLTSVPYAFRTSTPPPSTPPVILWSGSCSTQSLSGTGSFVPFCLDTVIMDTAAGYLDGSSGTDVTVLVPGYYRVRAQAISHSGSTDTNLQSRITQNGTTISSYYKDSRAQDWTTQSNDITWEFAASDVIAFDYLVNNTTGKEYDAYNALRASRVLIQYLGTGP